jgi:ABC-type nitrate/sulfonate/bicarbonate transport system substrate-binding protein
MPRCSGLVGALLTAALLAGACGGDDGGGRASPTTEPGTGTGTEAMAVRAGEPFPEARCQANRDAGTITFLTSFDYAAAASIIDVVAADDQGYFEQLCLDVKLQPGFSSANVATVSSGAAQMTSLGSFSEVAVANSKEAELVAVAVEGHTSIEELLVEDTSGITSLSELEGKSIGIKGAIPYSLRVMLARQGVDESAIKQIEVDFNPVTLFETDIVALPVYKSNEPAQLDAQGYAGRYSVFDPADDDIPASFAVFTTSRSFAEDHPTAVADFLRAALRGFEWAEAHPEEAVAATLERSDPNLFFGTEGETFRWATESELVRSSTPAGRPVGAIDREALTAEVEALVELGVVEADEIDVDAAIDETFVADVTDGAEVVWPG